MSMTFLQMSAFREVMRLGSVSEAARSLLRTQPAISAQIKALETELQCALFERKGKRLVALPEAHYLLREAERILESLEAVERNMRNLRHQLSGELTIVSMQGPTVEFLPEVIADFTAERPDVNVTLISQTSDQVEQLVATQNYDLGIADALFATGQESTVLNHKIYRFDTFCAVRKDNPLALKPVITPSDVSGAPIGCLLEEHPVTQRLRSVFNETGAELNARFRSRYYIPLLRFIERGQCYGIMDAVARETYNVMRGSNAELVFVPFEPRIPLEISLMTPKHRPLSQLADLFRQTLEDRLGSL